MKKACIKIKYNLDRKKYIKYLRIIDKLVNLQEYNF